MQPITIDVPAEYIGVLKLFTGKGDDRAYTEGIALEVGPNESRLMAMDGHRFGVFRVINKQPTIKVPFIVVIPTSMVGHIKPSKGPVSIEIDMDGLRIHEIGLLQDGIYSRGQPMSYKYPDWRKAMPKGELSGQVAQFNPGYIGDLGKAAALLHGRSWVSKTAVVISHNGDSAAVIDLGHPDFTGAIMPWKTTKAPGKMPTWALDKLQVVKEETVRERIARAKAA